MMNLWVQRYLPGVLYNPGKKLPPNQYIARKIYNGQTSNSHANTLDKDGVLNSERKLHNYDSERNSKKKVIVSKFDKEKQYKYGRIISVTVAKIQ